MNNDLRDALDMMGFRNVDAEDVREAIYDHNRNRSISANLAQSIMKQVLTDKPSWQLGIIETLDKIRDFLEDK